MLAGAALVVTPWMARNESSVGCFVLTTDTRALWKANNENTYDTLDRGGWIDDVPEPPNGPPWPELAADLTLAGQPTEIDECEQQRYYRELVFDFWRDEPGEKARLSAQAVRMLWSPTFSVDSDDSGRGRLAELGRDVVEPVYMVLVYALAIVGAFLVPRRFLALVLLLQAYSTLAAMAFAGTVRYRAPFDFLLALLAAAALVRGWQWLQERRAPAEAPRVKILHLQRIGGIGGSERHVLELLPALRARGLDARFLGLDNTAAAPEPFYDVLSARGVPFERLECPRDIDPGLARRTSAAVSRFRPDLVHTHLVHADVYGALAAGEPRAARLDEAQRRPLPRGARSLRRASPDAPSCSRDLHHGGARALQPRGRGASAGEAPRRPLRPRRAAGTVGAAGRASELAPETPVLLAICRLVPQKGVDVAIEAMPQVLERHADAHLVVLGEGPLRTRLAALADAHGVEEAVSFPGRVGDVAWWLRRAAVLVHPARWEGFGLALLEAMLSERPVVASAVSSIPEIVVEGETGQLVPPDDAERPRRGDRRPARASRPGVGDGRGRARARARGVLGRADGRANGRRLRGGSELPQVESLDPLRRALLRERLQRAAAPRLAHRAGAGQVGGDEDHRVGERLGISGGNDEAGLAVRDDLGQAADVARDHRADRVPWPRARPSRTPRRATGRRRPRRARARPGSARRSPGRSPPRRDRAPSRRREAPARAGPGRRCRGRDRERFRAPARARAGARGGPSRG